MATKIAIVGAGYWGPNLIRNFASLPEAELLMICDLDQDRLSTLSAQYPTVQTTSNIRDVLTNDEVEAVVIATPAEDHCHSVTAALAAGKHVFVEKPLATNSQDAELMVQMAEEKGLVLMVGHIFLFQAAIERLIEMVESGEIGDILYAQGVRTSMAGTARLDTNIVWDALVHDAYLLPAVFGRSPERVLAVGGSYLSPNLEDVAFVTFDFGQGQLVNLYVSWYALEKARRLSIIGREAILHYDDLAPSPLMHYDRRYEQSEDLDPHGRPRWHWRDGGGEPVALDPAEPLKNECRHFLECITQGQVPRTDGRSGLQAIRVLEACQASLEFGSQWVEVR